VDRDLGIGSRLRAARERLAWSREALAFHSGMSWSAIAQMESGRRKNARPDTLSELSRALGVSIDYLIHGGSHPPTMLGHQVVVYATNEQFVANTSNPSHSSPEPTTQGLSAALAQVPLPMAIVELTTRRIVATNDACEGLLVEPGENRGRSEDRRVRCTPRSEPFFFEADNGFFDPRC
jgi:transcriptional regulator with XRE-family HTH domain